MRRSGSWWAYHFAPTLLGIIAGGLLGAALGVLNYELVSVRWLKLAPARTR